MAMSGLSDYSSVYKLCHRPRKAIVQLACTMIEYLPVSYSVLVSSPNGLVVMVTDSRTVDHWFDAHLLKKGFSYFCA